jgi:hypothetical protein
MSAPCPVCRRPVEPGLKGMRLECKHWVHTSCLDQKNPNFEQCAACRGQVSDIPVYDPAEPGHDYVMAPISDSIFTKLKRSIQKEPYVWFAEPKKPLEWIVREKGFTLQKMLRVGVTFQDFMDVGYSWEKDIRPVFKDFAIPDRVERGREALASLRMTSEHLRDYPHLVGTLQKDMCIVGRHLVELYGLYYPDKTKPLRSMRRPWIAKELVGLGFTMTDLYGAGLENIEQYADLKPTDADEDAMGVTDGDVDGLLPLEAAKPRRVVKDHQVIAETPPVVVAAAAAAPAPISPPQRRRIYIELPKIVVVDRPTMTKIHGLRSNTERIKRPN